MLLAAPFLAALLLQAPAADEAASLVPADAAILVRLDSLAGLAELARPFAQLDEAEPPSPAELLAGFSYPGPAANVDPTRPVYVALAFALDQPAPALTWIVPAVSGTSLGIDDSDGAFTLHVAGDYTSITSRPGVARPSAPSPLVAALQPGLVAVHLDLATLIERFRPLIETGLRMAETQYASLPVDESMAFDPEAMLEWYLGLAREVVDSAETLDLALARQADQLTLRGRYRVKPGSPQESARVETAALAPLAGLIDPDAALQVVANGSWRDLVAPFDELMETMVDVYPEPFRTDFARMLDLQLGLGEVLLPGVAMGSDFTTEGIRLNYVLRARDPARVLATLEEIVRAFDHEDGLVAVGAPERLVLDGFEGRVLPLAFRQQALAEIMAMGGQAVEEDAVQELEEMIHTLYGRNLRLALAAHGELVTLALGNNDSVLRADLQRLARPALAAPKVLALVDEIPPGALGAVYHFDLGRALARMLAAMRGVVDLPFGVFPERDFSVDFWGAILERDYTGGTRMDLAELVGFARAVRESGGK